MKIELFVSILLFFVCGYAGVRQPLFHFKAEEAECLASVGFDRNKTQFLYTQGYLVLDEAQVIFGNVQGEKLSAFAFALDLVFGDKCRGKLEFGLLLGIIARHIIIAAVKIAVKHQTNFLNIGVGREGIFDHLARLADP